MCVCTFFMTSKCGSTLYGPTKQPEQAQKEQKSGMSLQQMDGSARGLVCTSCGKFANPEDWKVDQNIQHSTFP